MARNHPHLPDTTDPHFDRKMLATAYASLRDVRNLILQTSAVIAATKLMIAEADRVLERL